MKVHYMNKYPGGKVFIADDSLDVYDASGEHVVALRKNGAGQLVCQSEQLGCKHKHDLAPIPKDARLYKMRDGKVSKDEKFVERIKLREEFLCGDDSKILSCEELKAQGYRFDDKQVVQEKPIVG